MYFTKSKTYTKRKMYHISCLSVLFLCTFFHYYGKGMIKFITDLMEICYYYLNKLKIFPLKKKCFTKKHKFSCIMHSSIKSIEKNNSDILSFFFFFLVHILSFFLKVICNLPSFISVLQLYLKDHDEFLNSVR